MPAAFAGVMAVIWVALFTVTEGARRPPKETAALALKPLPAMVTWVPPAAGPPTGETAVGSGAEGVTDTEFPPCPPQLARAQIKAHPPSRETSFTLLLVLLWTLLRTHSLLLPPAPAVPHNERLVKWMKPIIAVSCTQTKLQNRGTDQILGSVLL